MKRTVCELLLLDDEELDEDEELDDDDDEEEEVVPITNGRATAGAALTKTTSSSSSLLLLLLLLELELELDELELELLELELSMRLHFLSNLPILYFNTSRWCFNEPKRRFKAFMVNGTPASDCSVVEVFGSSAELDEVQSNGAQVEPSPLQMSQAS
jgi:hypothetical protein